MAPNRPVEFPSTAYVDLTRTVPRGEFLRFDTKAELPSALSHIAGFPTEDQFRTTLVMSSSTSATPPAIGGITPASTAPIIRVSVIKVDRHGPHGEEHFNQYDSLISGDVDGRRWRLHAADQPGHYERLSNDSRSDAALRRRPLKG